MKKSFENTMGAVLAAVVFYSISAVPDAQGQDANSFKSLLQKKFDTNSDGMLFGAEKEHAVTFLKKLDKNGDGQISADEQKAGLADLKKIPDPVVSPAVVKSPVTSPAVMPASTKEPLKEGEIREGVIPKIKIIGRVTEEEIEKRRNSAEAIQKMKDARRRLSKEVQKPIQLKNRSFYDGSAIIAVIGDKVHCVVPEGAVLSVPAELGGMIELVKQPLGELMRWPEFLKKYSRWLKTREVSWETVKGDDPIKAEEKKSFVEGGKIIIAVFHKNPVTVLPPPPEDEVEEEEVKGALGSDTKKK